MGTVRVFDFEINIHGARVVVQREPLCPGCIDDGEIDRNIQLLKDDLDAVAKRMKLAVQEQKALPITFDAP